MKCYVASQNWTTVSGFRRGGFTRPAHAGPMAMPAVFTLKFAGGCAACAARIEAGIEAVGFKPEGSPRFIIWHNAQPCIDKMIQKGMYPTEAGAGVSVSVTDNNDPWLKAYDDEQ